MAVVSSLVPHNETVLEPLKPKSVSLSTTLRTQTRVMIVVRDRCRNCICVGEEE